MSLMFLPSVTLFAQSDPSGIWQILGQVLVYSTTVSAILLGALSGIGYLFKETLLKKISSSFDERLQTLEHTQQDKLSRDEFERELRRIQFSGAYQEMVKVVAEIHKRLSLQHTRTARYIADITKKSSDEMIKEGNEILDTIFDDYDYYISHNVFLPEETSLLVRAASLKIKRLTEQVGPVYADSKETARDLANQQLREYSKLTNGVIDAIARDFRELTGIDKLGKNRVKNG